MIFIQNIGIAMEKLPLKWYFVVVVFLRIILVCMFTCATKIRLNIKINRQVQGNFLILLLNLKIQSLNMKKNI
jgi:hypothetical protein